MLDVYKNYSPKPITSSSDEATENQSMSKSETDEMTVSKEEDEEEFLEEQRILTKSRNSPKEEEEKSDLICDDSFDTINLPDFGESSYIEKKHVGMSELSDISIIEACEERSFQTEKPKVVKEI